ncbi:MAG: hypothetical protein PHG36_11620 [Dehalococcoidia bacterium]|nr:hypothetical protein [Dehalococcoidia bacterium]
MPVAPAEQSVPFQSIATPSPDIEITIGSAIGTTIRPLLGVNVGPLPAGTDPSYADLTNAYKEIGVNLVRTHDYYQALDMSVMYPDETRDPASLSSYDFTKSDQVWHSIISGGFEPYFRLGDSWNDSKPPANAIERANWVKASIEVLRHYYGSKWSGFNTKFRYVEIWNEPDNQQFWPRPRTPKEYFQLYVDTAFAIRSEFPALKIGGPGVTPAGALMPQGKKWTQDLLDFVRQNNAPMDFFSWHMYSNSPQEYADAAEFYRSMLDARGFTQTTTHITEWNTQMKKGEENSPESIALRTGGKGAVILSAAWIELQKNNLEVSTFYRGTDTDIKAPTFYGMYYADGRPKHIALAFSLWSKISGYSQRLGLNILPATSLWTLAGQDGTRKAALLIANPGEKSMTAGVGFADGRPIDKIALYQVNDSSNQVQIISLSTPQFEIPINTVQLLVFE